MDHHKIKKNLEIMIENPKCELNYNNDWQLLIAILLSAQCTDKKVNKVTPILFEKYPTLLALKNANIKELEKIIYPLGLSKTKARNIINLATIIHDQYNDVVPNNKNELLTLPGIGTKTANVMLIEYFKIPAFPVDTHVARVSKRLNLCEPNANTKQIEQALTSKFQKKDWADLHMRMVLFGRYICKSRNPKCHDCLFKGTCNK